MFDSVTIMDRGFLIGENAQIVLIGDPLYVWNMACWINGYRPIGDFQEIDDRLLFGSPKDLGYIVRGQTMIHIWLPIAAIIAIIAIAMIIDSLVDWGKENQNVFSSSAPPVWRISGSSGYTASNRPIEYNQNRIRTQGAQSKIHSEWMDQLK